MPIGKITKIILSLFLVLFFVVDKKIDLVRAYDCNNPASLAEPWQVQTCMDKIGSLSDLISKANTTNKTNLKALQDRVNSLKTQTDAMLAQLEKKQADINKRNSEFDQEYAKLSLAVKSYYIRSYYPSGLIIILGSKSATDAIRMLGIYSLLSKKDRDVIVGLATTLADLQKEKIQLQSQVDTVSALKKDVDAKAQFLAGEVAKAEKYEQQLQGQIAALSARQQDIINARSGSFTVSIGDSELADDYNASIKGFRESAPGGYFAAFSFGAYTHRNGMSQYGALGHVKSQSWGYDQILKHYYPGVSINDGDPNQTIVVNGVNSYDQSFNNESYNIEDYLKHIYEVPASWPAEILKAQAIAARSYAYGKGTICPGQGCQEFKREENADAWKAAVEVTRGKIMSGGPGNWQYSSTTGGWINGLGWDTTDGQGGSNFVDKSFEKIAGSPWVYKAWYTKTYRNDSDKCGRSNPWLSPEEMADIVNAAIALKTGGIDTSKITPVTTSCWGGNPYSMDELKNLVAGNGGISSANSVSVSQGDGNTNNVTINGVSLSGTEFKKAFNLRAPGRLSIPQSGFAFFNIEKR